MQQPARFEEVQRFRSNWAAALAGVAALACIAAAGLNLWHGAQPPLGLAVTLVVMLLVGFLLFFGQLRTEVRDDGLHVQLFPLTRRHHFAPGQIQSCAARRYRPILEYGGWGVRYGRGGKAYNVYGNRGVQLELSDGRRLLVGSQRAEELALAIDALRAR